MTETYEAWLDRQDMTEGPRESALYERDQARAERDALRAAVQALADEWRDTAKATEMLSRGAPSGRAAFCSAAIKLRAVLAAVPPTTDGPADVAWTPAERDACHDPECVTPCLSCARPASPEPTGADDAVERACEVMHAAYEAAAVGAGWETQAASRKPWADVPEVNKATMRAAISALLDHLAAPAPPVVDDETDGGTDGLGNVESRVFGTWRAYAEHLEECGHEAMLVAAMQHGRVQALAGLVNDGLRERAATALLHTMLHSGLEPNSGDLALAQADAVLAVLAGAR